MENNSKIRWVKEVVSFSWEREREEWTLENSPIHLTSSLYRGARPFSTRVSSPLLLKTLKLQAAFSVGASSGEDPLIVNECKTENTGRGLSPKSLGRYKIRPGNGTMEVFGGRNCCCCCSPSCPFHSGENLYWKSWSLLES